MKRIYSFDLLKFIFAIIIAMSHYNTNLPGAFAAVEFFFVLSGFFLARKYFALEQKEIEYSPYNYTKDHVKTLYPHYIFSLLMIFIYPMIVQFIRCIKSSSGFGGFAREFCYRTYNLIPEIFMVQNIGIFPGGINYPLWQLCVLIVVSHFIYTMLNQNSKFTVNFWCPLIIVLSLSFLSNTNVHYDPWGTYVCLYVPLIRCLGYLCIGIVLYKISEKLLPMLSNKKLFLIFNIFSILSVTLVIFGGGYNNIYIILSCVVILACSCEKSWINYIFNRTCFKNMGVISYAIYLNHALIIYVFKDVVEYIGSHFNYEIDNVTLKVCFAVVLLLYSKFTVYLISKTIKKY